MLWTTTIRPNHHNGTRDDHRNGENLPWDEWADENGNLGPVYGKQWRAWPTPDGRHIDQITTVMNQLKNDPDSRRIIVSAWNVGELDKIFYPARRRSRRKR